MEAGGPDAVHTGCRALAPLVRRILKRRTRRLVPWLRGWRYAIVGLVLDQV